MMKIIRKSLASAYLLTCSVFAQNLPHKDMTAAKDYLSKAQALALCREQAKICECDAYVDRILEQLHLAIRHSETAGEKESPLLAEILKNKLFIKTVGTTVAFQTLLGNVYQDYQPESLKSILVKTKWHQSPIYYRSNILSFASDGTFTLSAGGRLKANIKGKYEISQDAHVLTLKYQPDDTAGPVFSSRSGESFYLYEGGELIYLDIEKSKVTGARRTFSTSPEECSAD